MSYSYNRRRKNIRKLNNDIKKGVETGHRKCNSPEEAAAFINMLKKWNLKDKGNNERTNR